MKKIILFFLIVIACTSVKAQLANKKWNGTLQMDQPTEVTLEFKKDTLYAVTTGNGQLLETMTYTVKNKVLTLIKVAGQSECGETPGNYKFEIKNETLVLTVDKDECYNRSNVLDKTSWKKTK